LALGFTARSGLAGWVFHRLSPYKAGPCGGGPCGGNAVKMKTALARSWAVFGGWRVGWIGYYFMADY